MSAQALSSAAAQAFSVTRRFAGLVRSSGVVLRGLSSNTCATSPASAATDKHYGYRRHRRTLTQHRQNQRCLCAGLSHAGASLDRNQDHPVWPRRIGEPCDCETADHTIAFSEERDATAGTDSSRYLAAGAVRALWVRTRQGQLAEAMPRIRTEIARAENVIIESSSALRFLKPDIYASVLDPEVSDFKPSALRYLDRADALLMSAEARSTPAWTGISETSIASIPRFGTAPPHYSSSKFVAFVARKLARVPAIRWPA